jgi:ankyrin repeat protein
MASASNGHLEVVKFLVEHGADLNIQNKVSSAA